jgi:hypothetical protein
MTTACVQELPASGRGSPDLAAAELAASALLAALGVDISHDVLEQTPAGWRGPWRNC